MLTAHGTSVVTLGRSVGGGGRRREEEERCQINYPQERGIATPQERGLSVTL